MSNLKFLIPVFSMLIFAFSCSSDDDSQPQGELIVGHWEITDAWVDGQSVYDGLLFLAPCPLRNEFHFFDDNTLRINTFQEAPNSNSCEPGEIQNGTWSKNDEGYRFNLNGQTNDANLEFLNNNNFTTEMVFEGQTVLLQFTRQ